MKKVKKSFLTRAVLVFAVLSLVIAGVPLNAFAAQVTSRSVTLGSSAPGGVTTHQINFTTATTATIGSVRFLYCTTASGTCTTPTGLVTTAATLSAQTGATGFTINATTAGSPYITRTATSLPTATAVSFTLSNVTNPTTVNSTFFIRVTTYTGTDGSTGPTDTGVVAAAVTNQIVVNASVDETLTFCTGTSGITASSCAGATGTTVSLGSLTPSTTGSGTSQMGISTNAGSGYAITVNGTTLTSGANTITANASTAASTQGTSQFGINLRANTTPAVGADPAGAGTGAPAAGYNTVNQYTFNTGDQVASKASADNFRFYTVSYIANVTGAQAAGAYTTTLGYIATSTY